MPRSPFCDRQFPHLSACRQQLCHEFHHRESDSIEPLSGNRRRLKLFYDGEEPPVLPNLPKRKSSNDIAWGSAGKDARYLNKLRRLLSKTEEEDRKLILYMAQKMAKR
jgi:hypothetical protein